MRILSLLTRPANPEVESPREGEKRLRGPAISCLPSSASHSYMRRRRRSVLRIVFSANASDIRERRAARSDRRGSRAEESEREIRAISERAPGADRHPRGTRVHPFSRRCARKTDESSPAPVPRLVLHVSGDARPIRMPNAVE